MTTINNSENLIKRVGGIERAREIIYQAVGTATNFNVSNNHYAREVLRNRDLVWARYDSSTQSWFYDFSDQSRVCLNDLRTAIAEHDLKQCQHGYDIACLICGFGNENGVRVWRNQIESDDVTDIRNHVSPSTLVWDLAGGEDWTAEAERHG